MNKLGKSGAILMIIGSAFMLIFAIVIMSLGGFLAAALGGKGVILGLGAAGLILSIVNIVLASLTLANHQNLIIVTGVLGLVSLFFGVVTYVFPAILILVGSILLFCGKNSSIKTHEATVAAKTVPLGSEI